MDWKNPTIRGDKNAILKFLKENDYSIFWTLLSEKQFIGGSVSGRGYKGRLEISGVYYFDSHNKLKGTLSSRFDPPRKIT